MNWAILRTDALGDTLLTIPLAETIKRQKNADSVFFIASHKASQILPGQKYIDDYCLVDQAAGWWDKFHSTKEFIKKNKIDAIVYVGGSSAPVVAAFFSGVKKRAGLKSRWWSHLFLNFGVRQKRSRSLKSEGEWNHELLHPLGVVGNPLDSVPRLEIASQPMATARELESNWLKQANRKNLIIVHPGMSGHSLNWPMTHYAALMNEIENKYPHKFLFVISQTPSDRHYVESLMNELKRFPQVISQHFDGMQYGLPVTMGLMKLARLFVGPSTGTTHVANALSVNQLAFYPPIKAQSVVRWGPYQRNDNVLTFSPQVNCPADVKCLREKCSFYECMSTITPQNVMESINRFLEG